MPFWKKSRQGSNLWNELFHAAAVAINRPEIDQELALELTAIVSAGVSAAELSFKQCELFKKHEQLSFERARSFAEVFAMAMVSRWARNLCRQDDTLDQTEVWAAIAKDILRLFGSYDETRWQEAWLMDMQFNRDMDHAERPDHEGFRLAEVSLVLSLAARALGTPLQWELASPPIPASSTRDLVESGYTPPENALDTFVALNILSDATVFMFETYKDVSREVKRR